MIAYQFSFRRHTKALIKVVLDGLTNMLNMSDANKKTVEMTTFIEETDALEHLERLQEHENEVKYSNISIYFLQKSYDLYHMTI